MMASMSASTTNTSTTIGNSAHSSGWLNPASTRDPARQNDREIPQSEQPLPEADAGHGPSGQQRNRVIEKREERVAEPAQQDALRVVVPQTAPAQPGVVRSKIREQKFDGSEDAERDERNSVTIAAKPWA